MGNLEDGPHRGSKCRQYKIKKLSYDMGHKEWRKIAKKMRRKKIRSGWAQKRDALNKEEEENRKMSPNYEKRVAEEEALQIAAKEAEMKELEEKLRKWEEEEERVKEETKLREALLKELEEKNELKKMEKIEAEKQIAEKEEEKKRRVRDYLYNFATGVIDLLPDDMLIPSETQPGKEICPFFHKVAACRFWDTCSRNHIRPAVSKNLLFPAFYSHFSMSQLGQAEYDTDMSLEYDEKETYSHFVEFYQDIRDEFEKYGRLTHLFVCLNRESHLRGNVYVSYATEREAMTAFLKFNGRYYAGRVISCLFVNIPTWKSAICGLYFKKKCPKGDACNFLHVFKDPGPPFYEPYQDRSSSDEWRWSISPEQGRHNGHETMTGNIRRRNKRKERRRSRSIDKTKSVERRDDCNTRSLHWRSLSKEVTGDSHNTIEKKPIELNKSHSNKTSKRISSEYKSRRDYCDRRCSDNRRIIERRKNRNDERMKSRSPRRSRKRSSSKVNNHDGCLRRNKVKSNEKKKRNRSSSSSFETESSASDN